MTNIRSIRQLILVGNINVKDDGGFYILASTYHSTLIILDPSGNRTDLSVFAPRIVT